MADDKVCKHVFFVFFEQKTAYEMLRGLVGSEMCIRDRSCAVWQGCIEELCSMAGWH